MNYGPHTTGSDTIGELAEALSSLQTSMRAAAENSVNPHFKSKYADLASCWDAVRPHLKGLSITQSVVSSGKTVEITTLLMHASGQWLSSTLGLEARDPSPQATGSAITYGRRYGFCAALGISSGDDDGEAAQPSRPAPTNRPTAPAVQPIPLPADRRAKALEAFNEQLQAAMKNNKNPRDILGAEFKTSAQSADQLYAAAQILKDWNV